jgi:nitric oxide reductase NorE protein
MPPGGLLIWLFIVVEMFTFGAAFVAFIYERRGSPDAFLAAQASLNRTIAMLNTALLLSSGFCVAQGVVAYKERVLRRSSRWVLIGALLGFGFLVLKGFEYRDKIAQGHTMGAGDFWGYYWALTGFHFLHVAIGVALLLAAGIHLARGRTFATEDAGLETVGAFWHMCDLIWIMLFPLLYILR